MTRLFYEKMISDHFPKLQWIRVSTSAPYTITTYACDANLELDDETISALQQFLSVNGLASCVHKVKHYFELQNDEAFPIGQVPDVLKKVAIKGKVNRAGIQAALQAVFPPIDSEHFEVNQDTVTFYSRKNEQWTPYQRQFAELMLNEILPAGSTARLSVNPSNT